MTEEEKNQAAAFVKLQEDVRNLVLTTVYEELIKNPHGPLAVQIKYLLSQQLPSEMSNYRIVMKGHTAPSY